MIAPAASFGARYSFYGLHRWCLKEKHKKIVWFKQNWLKKPTRTFLRIPKLFERPKAIFLSKPRSMRNKSRIPGLFDISDPLAQPLQQLNFCRLCITFKILLGLNIQRLSSESCRLTPKGFRNCSNPSK